MSDEDSDVDSDVEFAFKNNASILTHNNLKMYNFTWRIENFSFHISRYDSGKNNINNKLMSPVFLVEEYDHRFQLVIEKCSKQDLNYKYYDAVKITIYPDNRESDYSEKYRYKIKISLFDIHDNKIYEKSKFIASRNLRFELLDVEKKLIDNTDNDILIVKTVFEGISDVETHKEIDALIPCYQNTTSNENLIDDKNFGDVTFIMSNKQIHAHKCILSVNSSYFAALFNTEMKKNNVNIRIKDDYDVFKLAIDYIYGKKIDISEEMLIPLLILADKYGIEKLKELCEVILCNSISYENAKYLTDIAFTYNLSKLKIRAVEMLNLTVRKIKFRDS